MPDFSIGILRNLDCIQAHTADLSPIFIVPFSIPHGNISKHLLTHRRYLRVEADMLHAAP
jgi:hypothetical protein